MDKEVKQLIGRLKKLGCDVTRSSSNHFVVKLNGNWVSNLPNSPRGSRWLPNAISELRRNGVAI